MWLLNKDEELKQKLTLISAKHTEETNGQNTLDFQCLEQIEKMDRVIYKDHNNKWHEFIVQNVKENRKIITVYAEHSSYELHGDFIEDKRPTATINGHLTEVLTNTRWTKGTISGSPTELISYYRQDVYESIKKIVEKFNAYLTFSIEVTNDKITARKVNITTTLGNDLGKRFTYTKDLQEVERTIMTGEIITALYGFGKGEEIGDGYGRRINFGSLDKPDSPLDKMYVEDNAAKAIWGRNSPTGKKHVFDKAEFDDIEDIEELYEATKAKLQTVNTPRINYRVKVVLLKEDYETVGIGDTVTIIDNDFRGQKLRIIGKVFKIKKDLLNGANSEVELGNYIEDTSDADRKLNDFVNNFRNKQGVWDKSNAFDADGKLDGSYITGEIPGSISNIIEQWNDELNGSGGFVYADPEGTGIITYDRAIDDNPTSAVQISGGGWRIANSKLENGQWDWKTVATGDGIAGDQIIANSITSNQLSSDFGSSLDISSNNAINQIVTQIDETTGLLQDEISSQVQHTVDNFSVIFNKIESDQDLTNGEIELIQSYFRINENGVIIGKSDSAIEFFAENNRVGFRENGNDIAYWEEGTMHVDRLIAVVTIMIGYHLIEKYDSPFAGNTTIVRLSD